jgi:hypothetical protein
MSCAVFLRANMSDYRQRVPDVLGFPAIEPCLLLEPQLPYDTGLDARRVARC